MDISLLDFIWEVILSPDLSIRYLKKTIFSYGGGGRIRTSEGIAGRFTVCSRWPLEYPSNQGENFEVQADSSQQKYCLNFQKYQSIVLNTFEKASFGIMY